MTTMGGSESPRRIFTLLACLLGLSLLFSSPAEAYIDPGTGSMVLQMLIAGVLGGAFALKRFWRKIIHAVRSTLRR